MPPRGKSPPPLTPPPAAPAPVRPAAATPTPSVQVPPVAPAVPDGWSPEVIRVKDSAGRFERAEAYVYRNVAVLPDTQYRPPLWLIYLPKSHQSFTWTADPALAFAMAGVLARELWRMCRAADPGEAKDLRPEWLKMWKDACIRARAAVPTAPYRGSVPTDTGGDADATA